MWHYDVDDEGYDYCKCLLHKYALDNALLNKLEVQYRVICFVNRVYLVIYSFKQPIKVMECLYHVRIHTASSYLTKYLIRNQVPRQE